MSTRVERWPAFVITGQRSTFPVSESFAQIPKIWQEAAGNSTIDELYRLWSRLDLQPAGILGISMKHLDDPEIMDYFLAVTTFVDVPDAELAELPEHMQSFKLPSVEWAVIEANGLLPTAMSKAYLSFSTEWLPSSGYISAPLPVIEAYIAENRQEIWFPVVPRE